jgi:SAM-dependent methyltransferase
LNQQPDEAKISVLPLVQLNLAQRTSCADIGDFLERDIALFDDRQVDAQVVVAVNEGMPVGWIRYSPRRFFNYSDGSTEGKMRSAAIIEFPVTNRYRPVVWSALFDAVLGALFEIGIGWSATSLPEGARGPAQFLEDVGYERLGEARSDLVERPVAWQVYIRKCTAARGFRRLDLTPGYTNVPFLLTATAATAPKPERESWEPRLIYSGYSGYPWIPGVLRYLLEPGATLLSVPCATGDLFRLMPVAMMPSFRHGVGVDLLERNVMFAKGRLEDPNIDLLNIALNSFFWSADRSIWSQDESRELFQEICGLAGRLMLPDEASDYFSQIQAIHREVVRGGAITDWFAATKALATLLTRSPSPSIVRLSSAGNEMFTQCASISERFGRLIYDFISTSLFPSGYFDEEETRAAGTHRVASRTEFVNDNMFTMQLNERFDVVFVWEAALMAASVGREVELVENLLRHVKPGGCLIMTGIRTDSGHIGRELSTAGSVMAAMGCRVTYGTVLPRASRWAIPFVSTPRFPYLAAIPKGGL